LAEERVVSPRHQPGKAPASKSSAPSRKKVMLVDDHPMLRAGLAEFINKQPDLEMCGEAGNAAEAMQQLPGFKPDLVLTDITMPGKGGIEFIKDLLALHPALPVLVVSMHDENIYAERVLRAGARGYIMKEAGGENLLAAIRQVLNGQVYVSPGISAKILDSFSARKPRGSSSPIEKLSDREFEIFQLIGQGKSTRDIALQLHLSPKTVEVHRGHIRDKLGLKDSVSLVHNAVKWVEHQDEAR
jgi:DNA-binding NarL/FixJ family response regulator